ncbi:glycosyltransferase family 4 protein [Mycolicibacterium iranicum]|uniref:Glycosyltransferase family 4 protein n=1 Tax=Mycolicibacterium iranicum TaxID=912594 RepID=A0A1X1WVM3_MYCIR|nr:glycosyltransferase family 4 protein [Mycolicibacterium iranicum]MCZ0730122.1 glycosyltransferase family 4 protein [Mycolicibacterium iranicum]ORV90528.1 hypothetical protein AWC12_07215 [Mycolicibacterium iranicum]
MKASALRIGLVVPRFAPFHGGVETYTMQAAAALATRDVDVTVVTQVPRASELPRVEHRGGYGVERHVLPLGDIFDAPSPGAIRAASRRGRFDVVWVHSYHTPLAWLVAEVVKVPVIFTPHYHGTGHSRIRSALHRAYRPAGGRLMATSDKIIVDTEAEANLVLRDFSDVVSEDKIVIIPPAVADPAAGQPYPSEQPIVLTVARQERYKRTDLLIRAIFDVHNRGVPARLVVVGHGTAVDAYRELAARLGASDIVTFTGPVDQETLGRWWTSASVYATASEQEAWGIGLAEALASGLPVAASAIPAHREVIRGAGSDAEFRLCEAGTSDAEASTRYADAIIDLLRFGQARPQRASLCDLPNTAEVGDRLYDQFAETARIANRR